MPQITRDSLMTLEAYAKTRKDFSRQGDAAQETPHPASRRKCDLDFEDELTIRYQIQEMLHAEKIFEEAGMRTSSQPTIADPDGGNWKATMMIEYPDPDERHACSPG